MENNIYDISDMHADAISLCDKYDFLASVCIGGCAGAIDVFFVGEPGFSKLGKATDKAVDNIVMRFAKAVGWSPKDGKQGNVASAIGFWKTNIVSITISLIRVMWEENFN